MVFGIIGFDHYKVSCIIGVLKEERNQVQDLYFDVRVEYDFSLPTKNDHFEKAVCYEKLSDFCKSFAVEKKYHLLETLALELLEALFKEFPITWGSLKIKKPSAIKEAHYAVIELEKGIRR
ncbi:MAG TPA: dihydroneopterin aldolase [Parachlamydiaceae bacterium]|nr:dihydroneopterin aldolase [Parachlamydiaceae bacterium]